MATSDGIYSSMRGNYQYFNLERKKYQLVNE